MKIAIYGTGSRAVYFSNRIEKENNTEVVYYVESKKSKEEFRNKKVIDANQMNSTDFDFLIIATIYFDEVINFLKINYQKYEEIANKIKSYELFLDFIFNAQISDIGKYEFVSLNCGINYLTHSSDRAIRQYMKVYGKSYSEDTIRAFFELTEKYSNVEQNYFLDIGANIGTTAIYVKKIMNKNLHVIGFEVGDDNYKLLKMNCVMNNVEDICCEHLGLGDKETRMAYQYTALNPGGSRLCDCDNATEQVLIETLDSYLEKNNINYFDISYLWIDAEGFEAKIIIGSRELLSKKRVPLMQEFNYQDYVIQGVSDEYFSIVMNVYKGFVDINEYCNGKWEVYNISELRRYAENLNGQADIFFF